MKKVLEKLKTILEIETQDDEREIKEYLGIQEVENNKELPKYICTKIVHALKIKEIKYLELYLKNISADEHVADMIPEEEGYEPIPLSYEYIQDHKPKIGGYYVVYKDGYKSFSPTKSFEEGYTRIY